MRTTPAPWRLRASRGRAVVAALAGASLAVVATGCPKPPQHRTVAMEPIGTVAAIPRDEPADDKTDRAGKDEKGATPAAAAPLAEGPCAGSDFDSLEAALRVCEVPVPKRSELPSSLKDKLEMRVTTAANTVTPGGRAYLTLALTNKSSEPLPLFFSGDPVPRFDVEAFDAKGRRVDRPPGRAPAFPKGYKAPARDGRASRVTLAPGGVARVRVAWDAVKTKWAPESLKTWDGRGYPVAAAGPLPHGKVTLRLVVPLLGSDLDAPKAVVDVAD